MLKLDANYGFHELFLQHALTVKIDLQVYIH
jgi:hypothetical protein